MANKKKTFEEALTRLEEIVDLLENQEVSLENSVDLYKEGMELSLFCQKKLDLAEKEVTMLQKDKEGNIVETPFSHKEEQ